MQGLLFGLRIFTACLIVCTAFFPLWAQVPPTVLKAKRSVVGISVRSTRAAYNSIGRWQGTGFLCDKENGLIITNKHVAPPDVVGVYTVLFFNGQKLAARFVYADPWHDVAVLKISHPDQIPLQAASLNRFKPARRGQDVYMFGSNQGQTFSFQIGRVTDLYQDVGFFPHPGLSVAVNSRGGSSGSPLLSADGDVVGLNYGGNGAGLGFALHSRLLQQALRALLQDKKPGRFHTGAIVKLTSLDSAVNFWGLSRSRADDWVKRFPDSESRILKVVGCLKGSPAEAWLKPGDLIISASGRPVGPSIVLLEELLNAANGGSVTLGVCRRGKFLKISVPTYNLHHAVIDRLLVFGGATIFQADDAMRWQFGVPLKRVMIKHVMPTSAFGLDLVPSASLGAGQGANGVVCALLGRNFAGWLRDIPELVKVKRFFANVQWLEGYSSNYAGLEFSKRSTDVCGIYYDSSSNLLPELIQRDKDSRWSVSALLCHPEAA